MKTARMKMWLAGGAVAVLLGPCALADPPSGYPFLSYDEGLAQARAANRRMFLYFGRYGCGWCDKTNREAFSDRRVHDTYLAHYVLVYVDAESGKRLTLPTGERITEMEFGARQKVYATPMFAYFEPDGKLIVKLAGIQTAKDFLEYDKYVNGEIYRQKTFQQFLAEQQRP